MTPTLATVSNSTITTVAPWVVTAIMIIIAAMGIAAGAYGLREAKEWRERSDHHRDLYRVEVAGRKDAEQRAASNAYEAQVAVRWVQLRDEREAAKQAIERDVSLRSLIEDDGWDIISTPTGALYLPPDTVTTDVVVVVPDVVDVGELTVEPVYVEDVEPVGAVLVPAPPVRVASWRDKGKTAPGVNVVPERPVTTAHGRSTLEPLALRAVTGPILTDSEAAEAKRAHDAGATWGELAERYGVAASTVARAARRA